MTLPNPPSPVAAPSAETLAAIVRALPVGIAAVDENGRQTYVNATFATMVGWDVEELIGAEPPFVYWPPEERDAIAAALGATVGGSAPIEGFKLRFARRDGSHFSALVSVAPIVVEGARSGWVAAVIDTTRETAAEAALVDRDQRLELALAAGRLGSWEYDLATGKVTWSATLERMHGLAEGRFGGTFEDYRRDIHPEDLESVLATIGRSASGDAAHELEYRIVRPDGETRWLETRGALLRDEHGRPTRMVGICSDVTERRITEQAIRDAKEAAEEANRSKSDFLARMSHDLRTPLNAMAGYLDLLDAGIYGVMPDEQRQVLTRLRRNQKQLLTLINDVLRFAQVEAGRLELDLRDWEVDRLLQDMGAMIEPQAAARGLAYVQRPAEASLSARGDLERTEQVLLNLLSNAVNFTDPGGRVELLAEDGGDRVHFRVRDTGCGIPEDKLEAIFDPFSQIDRKGGAREDAGVGLGLAISRDLARAMGGEIGAESVPGKGSVFTLTLPRASRTDGATRGS